jgi:hypothetical protein
MDHEELLQRLASEIAHVVYQYDVNLKDYPVLAEWLDERSEV